jgi:hypothetical protein
MNRHNAHEMIEKIESWHELYTELANMAFKPFFEDGVLRLDYIITTKGNKWSGRCVYDLGGFYCVYSLPYACIEGDKYHETVAHEVAHAVVRKLDTRAKSHGELWAWVMKRAFGVPSERCHHNNTLQAGQIGLLLTMQHKAGAFDNYTDITTQTKKVKQCQSEPNDGSYRIAMNTTHGRCKPR